MIKVWSYTEEYKGLRKKILRSVDKALKSGQIFFGKELDKFEKRFIKENNLKYGLAVGSGTDALYIALSGLGIKKNGIFSLPLYPELKVRELLRITKILKGILKHI